MAPLAQQARLGSAAIAWAATLAPREAAAQKACVAAYETAQEARVKNDLLEARRLLVECVATCPVRLRNECVGWRDELDRFLSSIRLRAKNSQGSPAKIDAAFVDARQVNPTTEVILVPGTHVVRVEIGDHTVEQSIVTKPSVRDVIIDLTLPAPSAHVADAPPPRVRESPSKTPSIVAFSIGGASAITALTLTIYGHVRRGDLDSTCKPNCTDAEVDAIATTWWVAAGFGIGAAAGLAVGLLLWPSRDVTLRASPGSVGISGTF